MTLNKPGPREAQRRAQREARYEAGGRKRVNTVNTVNTKAVNTTRRADRHSPGYMAEYMRQWRQRTKGQP